MTSYLTSMDTISLSRTVLEIFDFKVLRGWPWSLTTKDHLGLKKSLPFERPYMTSYLTSMDTTSLSLTVFEILDFKVLRVWPWPLTPKGHLGVKKITIWKAIHDFLFDFYWHHLSILYRSRDIRLQSFKGLTLTPKGRLGSKKSLPFKRPCMTSYLTSMFYDYDHLTLYDYLTSMFYARGSGKLSSPWSPGECTDDDITPGSLTLSSRPLIDRVCAAKACPWRDTNSLLRLCECWPGFGYCFR